MVVKLLENLRNPTVVAFCLCIYLIKPFNLVILNEMTHLLNLMWLKSFYF